MSTHKKSVAFAAYLGWSFSIFTLLLLATLLMPPSSRAQSKATVIEYTQYATRPDAKVGSSSASIPANPLIEFDCSTVTAIPTAECIALIALYSSTSGSAWTNHDGWLTNTNPCSWYGVTCVNDHVTALNLDYQDAQGNPHGNGLNGEIPAALGNLTHLQILYLSNNGLSGSLPATLGNLSNLQILNLRNNGLSGSLPATLGNLTNLQNLNLSNNGLSGSLPDTLGNLTNLQYLYLHYNQLSGEIPATLGNLSHLQFLFLGGNQLSGEIPATLGNLSLLNFLFLSANGLSGEIPAALGNLTSLQSLNLDYNGLSGEIPAALGNLTGLRFLYLSNNGLRGALPSSLTALRNLINFYFASTQLCVPDEPAMQSWLATIPQLVGTGVNCGDVLPTPTATETATPTPTPTNVATSTQLALRRGWNVFAFPLVLKPSTPATILAPIVSNYNVVYAYNGCDAVDPWKKYDPNAPFLFLNDLTSVGVSQGLWLRATGNVTLTVTGADPANTSIALCAGWNLIGWPGNAPTAVATALASIAGQYNLVYAYTAADANDPWKKYDPNAPFPFLNDLSQLEPGQGYWIRVTQATTLIVP